MTNSIDMQNSRKNHPKSKQSFWNRLALQSQLSLLVATIVAIIVTSITVASIQRENNILRLELEERALAMLESIEASTRDFLYWMDIDTIDSLGDSFASNPGVLILRIYDSNGRILSAPDNSLLEARLDADPYGAQLAEISNAQILWENDRIIVGQRFTVGRQVLGSAHVELSTENLTSAIQASIYRGIVSGLIMSIIGILAAILVGRRITNPITQIVDVTSTISKGDFGTHIEVAGGSLEIGELANSIELMRVNLQSLYQDLEDRIAERTEELKQSRDEALAAKLLAEENSRLKTEFLSTMSHELRTPLNAIEGFSSIMLAGMGIELEGRAYDYVTRISANSKRLLALINDLLDVSRIESGRFEVLNLPTSPRTITRNWQHAMSVLADEKGIEFIVTIDPEMPEVIYSDEDALSKIATNLLGNAFKFTDEGQVSLKIKRINDQWQIIVTDTGIGIPHHAQEFVFEKFRQVDGSSTRKYGGTGLGLALVQHIATAMNGQVTVQSEVGSGSTFTVTLPLVIQPEDSEQGEQDE